MWIVERWMKEEDSDKGLGKREDVRLKNIDKGGNKTKR